MPVFFLIAGGLLASLIAFIRFGLLVVTVEGQSMYPALQHGDRVLALRMLPRRLLRKGQIVVISPWLESNYSRKLSPGTETFIKRVVGVGGETLVTSIADLQERFHSGHLPAHDSQGLRTWHIPPHHIFVCSDNLPGGYDSLTWGPVPQHTVLGVVIMRLPRRTPEDPEWTRAAEAHQQLQAGQAL